MSRITLSLLAATALTGLIGSARAQTVPPQTPLAPMTLSQARPGGGTQEGARAGGASAVGAQDTGRMPVAGVPDATPASPARPTPPAVKRGGTGGPLQLTGDMAGIIEMVPHIVCLNTPDARPPALPAHLDGRLAFLKAELRITDAQTAKWTEFVDAVRAAGKLMLLPCTDAARIGTSPSSLERIETAGKLLSARADALKTVASNGRTLYASLSDEQKTLADDLMFAPVWQ